MPSKRRLRWVALPLGIAAAALLAGCTPEQLNGFLPGFSNPSAPPATNHTQMVRDLWFNSWVVLLIVGLTTWGLLIFAMVTYRRRKGQTGLPVQLRYHMPIEILYTAVPLILVAGLFAITARDINVIEHRDAHPDVAIAAIGKQWSWDFQYDGGTPANLQDTVWTMGTQIEPNPQTGVIPKGAEPVLYLPVNKTVRIDLRSRDVVHSFWIVDFLYKEDMFIGHDNSWSFTPTRVGTFQGECAELCGEYHSAMLFKVKVVPEAEYQQYLQSLQDKGQTGDITTAYDRQGNNAGTLSPQLPAGEGQN